MAFNNTEKAAAMARFKSGPMRQRGIRAEEQAECDFEIMLKEMESPIEATFLAAIFEDPWFDEAIFWCNPAHKHFGSVKLKPQICAQYSVDVYRCDFAFWQNHNNGTVSRLIVECDGHDFHEKTKEQAQRDKSRDRTLTAHNWKVLRFTGSELYKDALKCVEEVALILEGDEFRDWRLVNG